MSKIPQVQLEELERSILNMQEYDKIEITYKNGRVDITKKTSRKVVINC